MLVRKHADAGHEVLVLASTETYNGDGQLTYVDPSTYFGSDGALVKRLPYRWALPSAISRKLRCYSSVYDELCKFSPDVIVFHGLTSLDLLTVSRYAAKNPHVVLYADSHEDHNNSAKSFFSRLLLYRFFYRPVIKLSLKNITKILYITYETKLFCNDIYGLSDKSLEFFPLGGDVVCDHRYSTLRGEGRLDFGVGDDEVVFFQSGKFDKRKKLIETLRALAKIENRNIKLLLAGVMDDQVTAACSPLIESDDRVIFLGWVGSNELMNLLCLSDVYVQPGSQSATMQMALAARCAVVLDDVPSHRETLQSRGILVGSQEELADALATLAQSPSVVREMQELSYEYAKDNLDYTVLAQRLLR